MGVLTRAKKRRLLEHGDRIGGLPDDVLRDIVARLPTKDGARTQALSSRWRHIWRSTPLNLAPVGPGIPVSDVHRILSAHPGPGRRFSMPAAGCYIGYDDDEYTDTTLDEWLRCPALDGLEELQFHHNPRVPMPPSVQRFSSTLAVATFSGCGFPDEDYGGDPLHLHLPHLKSLTLADVSISGRSLHALLAGCPALQSLLLVGTFGSPRLLKITSPSLRSIGVESCWRSLTLKQLIIEDAPCLELLLCTGTMPVDISVISAPRLAILGKLSEKNPRIQIGSTVFQGSTVVGMAAEVHGVKVLSLSCVKLCLDAIVNLLKCFPHLEKLYIEASSDDCVENARYQTNSELNDIRLREIVLANYHGSKSHVDFVRFFLSNASELESLRLESRVTDSAWIARQHRLLDIKKTASTGARVAFVSPKNNRLTCLSHDSLCAMHVHDLSTNPFQRVHRSNDTNNEALGF